MSNVLLIAPTGAEDPCVEAYGGPHHGLHRIAGYLRIHGHSVKVWDKWYDDHSLEEVLAEQHWGLIGFSTISHTLPQDIEAMRTARKLCPDAILVAGGIESAMNFQELFDHTDIDGIVLAEGEDTLDELMYCLDHGMDDFPPNGIIWRARADPVDSDTLWEYWEKIDFAAMNYPRYWQRIRDLTKNPDYEPDIRLVTESHCNRNCIFCSQTNFHRRAVGKTQPPALLSAEQIYDLICRAKTALPELRRVYFDGDDFFINRDRALTFFRQFAQRNTLEGFKYLAEASLPSIDEELVAVGAANGLKLLNMGLENCSQRVLKTLGKPQDVRKVFQVVSWCRKYGVEPYILILLFPPESIFDDLRLNVEMLTDLMESGATLSIIPNLRPYRGTRLYEMDYDFEWKTVPLEGGGSLKQAQIAWCRDPDARMIQKRFWERWLQRFAEIKSLERLAVRRRTAPEMVAILRDLLDNFANSIEVKGCWVGGHI